VATGGIRNGHASSERNQRQINCVMSPTSDRWKHFERLVAAIHQAASRGADVRWDDIIDGRQFDVTIRFRHGLHEYLTVVECKDCKHPVPVGEVEAFVTKSKDVHAHKSVMASASGFQSGAQEVAQRHNITLIEVDQSTGDVDPSLFGARWVGTTPAFHIQRIELEYCDGERKSLPEESNVLTYYVGHVLIQQDSRLRTLEEVLQPLSPDLLKNPTEYQDFVIHCESGAHVIGPDDGEVPLKAIARVHVRAGLSEAQVLDGPRMFDPSLLVRDVIVRDVATGEQKSFKPNGLKLGFKTTFAKGRFYGQPQNNNYYYCDEIEGKIARLYLVESFQMGELVQAEFTVETQHANYYIPVLDEATLKRLHLRLDQLRSTLKRTSP
jgi:hypothetical protein